MSRIFISHSSVNNAPALALGLWLEAQGLGDYFLDFHADRGIAPGERWMAALTGAVDRCEAVIFLVSPAWRDSKYCFAEFFEAKKLGKRIFGVMVEPISLSELPDQMTSEWQLCNLCAPGEADAFTVSRQPLVPNTEVHFTKAALTDLARGLRKAGLDASTFVWPPPDEPQRAPYPGLRALDAPDAAVFFGRDAAIVRAIDQIRLVRERSAERLVVILGASGAGKSSFLRAGVLPRLQRDTDHFVVLPTVRSERAAMSGQHGLLLSLQTALAKVGHAFSLAQVREVLASEGLNALCARLASGTQTVVVPIDQFEELFATDGRGEAEQFLALIDAAQQAAMKAGSAGVLFVVTIRSDMLPVMQNHPALQRMAQVLFSLPAMPASEFKAVIEGPAQRHTAAVKPLSVTPQLTEILVTEAQGADALPLLALTLDWLYREFSSGQGTKLDLPQYDQIGRVRGVINKAVERAFAQPDQAPAIPADRGEQEALLARIFVFIATIDPDTGLGKRRVALRDALRHTLPPAADALVTRLVENRLLLSDRRVMREDVQAEEVIEVAHEALLRQWDLLAGWLHAMASELAVIEVVRRCANEWQRNQSDDALLVHTAHRLQAAEALLVDERTQSRLDQTDQRYLAACRARDTQREQEREAQLQLIAGQQAERGRLLRRFGAGLGAFALVVTGLLVWVVLQSREVSIQTSLVLSSAAEAAMDSQAFDRAVRLSILAAKDSWLQPAHTMAMPVLTRSASGNALRAKLRHGLNVTTAVFSPDGKRILTAADKTAQIWDAKTGLPLGKPMTHGDVMGSAVFSPDGKLVLTTARVRNAGSNDDAQSQSQAPRGSTRLWSAETQEPFGETMVSSSSIVAAKFSENGRYVLTVSGDDTARRWDARTGKPLAGQIEHSAHINFVVFSNDGQKVLIAEDRHSANIWDANTGKLLAKLKSEAQFEDATFSPDGRRVLNYSSSGQAGIWDAQSGKPLGQKIGIESGMNSFVLSKDGLRILTTSPDGMARSWDAQKGRPIGEAFEVDAEISFAKFSPNGQRFLTVARDATMRIWEAETRLPLGEPMKHGKRIRSAQFSPDGQSLLSVSNEGEARVWDVQSGRPLGMPLMHDFSVISAQFSPDGSRVVTAAMASGARVWDAQTTEPLGNPLKHDAQVVSAAFSKDGSRILTFASDGTTRLWNGRTTQSIGEPMKLDVKVNSARLSQDGQLVLTTSTDKTAQVWDAQTHKPVGASLRHGAEVTSAAFSPDSRFAATVTSANVVQVWDISSGKAVGQPMKHASPVNLTVFTQDAHRLLTASLDNALRLWDPMTGKAQISPMNHGAKVVSIVLHPDGRLIATAADDGKVRVWDIQTGKPYAEMLTNELARSVEFSPDGRRVVTTSIGETARVWDLQTGKPLTEPLSHANHIRSAVFSPDGKRILTASVDHTARIWPVELTALSADRPALIAAACQQMNPEARRLTADDLKAASILSPDQKGKDVCEGINVAPTR